jgi:hypothetical protein
VFRAGFAYKAPPMGTTPLRPLRVGEILDAAIKLYLRNARTMFGAAAAVVVPLQAISALVLMSIYSSGNDIPIGFSTAFKAVPAADVHARTGANGIILLCSFISSSLVLAVCVHAVSSAYLDQPVSASESLRFGARRLVPLIVMQVLLGLALLIAFILLVIPGIWLYASAAVAAPVLVIEHRGPIRSIRRSIRLVRGRWWSTAGVLLFATVMAGVLTSIVSGLLTALALSSSNPSVPFAAFISFLSGTVSGVLVLPFRATVNTVLYYDLRVRHEGYDLQLLAEQLGMPQGTLGEGMATQSGFTRPMGSEMVGQPGGPPYWPPPPGWTPEP